MHICVHSHIHDLPRSKEGFGPSEIGADGCGVGAGDHTTVLCESNKCSTAEPTPQS